MANSKPDEPDPEQLREETATDPVSDDIRRMREEHDPVVPGLRKPPPDPRKAVPLLVVPIIGMIIMTQIANAIWPQLVPDPTLAGDLARRLDPTAQAGDHSSGAALLMLLSSQNRYLVAATNYLDPLAYYGIGMFRLLLPDPFFYLLGYWYGETVIRWVEQRSQTYGLAIRQFEKLFDKASWLVVTIFPNNPVCLIAGTARMSPILFAACNVIGTFGRLLLFRLIGAAFQAQIDSILGFVANYRLPLTVLSFTAVGFILFRDWRAGKGEIQAIRDLEGEIKSDFDPEGR